MSDPRSSQLSAHLARMDHTTTHAAFWAGCDRSAGNLTEQVWPDDVAAIPAAPLKTRRFGDVDPELREAYTDLLASADDGGWVVPMEQCQP